MDSKNNLVIYGVPEQVNKDRDLIIRSEKIKQDKMIVKGICNVGDEEICEDDLIEIRRVGKYYRKTSDGAGAARPKGRPIVVMLREGIKDKILRNAYKLKDLNTQHSDIIRGVICHKT